MTSPRQLASCNTAESQPLVVSNGLISSSSRSHLRLKDTLLMATGYRTTDANITREPPDSPASSQFLSVDHSTNRNDNSSRGNGSMMTSHPAASTSSAGSNSQDRSPTLLESPDDNLRTTCDSCTISKIKCDGGHPCKRCQRRKSDCVYSEKKRCGPKRRRSHQESEDDSDTIGGSWDGGRSHDGEIGGVHKILTSRERRFLAKFHGSVNKFIPLTSLTVLRDAMNPLPLNVICGISASESEKNVHHARKAVLLGCVGLGAVFCGDSSSAGAYMAQAQIHLKDCFDALLPEVVSCYLIMVVYHLYFLDHSKIFRYIGFAQQAFRELVSSKQPVSTHLRDSVGMLSTFLHVACNNDIRVEEVDLRAENIPESGNNHLSRILAIFSHVLLMLYRRFDPDSAAKVTPHKPPPSNETLAAMADEADMRLSMIEDPGSFAMIVLKTLRGYFLLLKGKEQEVMEFVALPVAKALAADTGVLCFPLCWHMCQCMSVFLKRQGAHTVAASMDQVMDPLKQTLVFATTRCGVAVNVMSVYAGKGVPASTSVGGVFSTTTTSAGGADGGGGSNGQGELGPNTSASEKKQQQQHRHHRGNESEAVGGAPAAAASAAAAAAAAAALGHYPAIQGQGQTSSGERDVVQRHSASNVKADSRRSKGEGGGGGGGGEPGGVRTSRGASVGAWGQTIVSRSDNRAGAASVGGIMLDNSMFVSSSVTQALSSAPAPPPAAHTQTQPMPSHIGLEYMNVMPRHQHQPQNMFDLGGSGGSVDSAGHHAFVLGGTEHGSHQIPATNFVMRGAMGRSGGNSGRDGGESTANRAIGKHCDSTGSSPLEGGLSSDSSPSRGGSGHHVSGDSGDGGDAAMLSGMFVNM